MVASDVLKFIYANDTFPGWGQLWGVSGGIPCRFLKGFKVGDAPVFRLSKHDTYIIKNIMERPDKRCSAGLFAYNAIVIDADLHEDGYTFQQIDAACDRLRDLVSGCEYVPSMFVKTGRGCQIWFLLEPIHKKCKRYYDLAQKALFEYIGQLIEQDGLPFVVDKAVKDPARLLRFPGSYNSKVRRWGSYEIMNRDRYSVQGILEEFGVKTERPAKPAKAKNQVKVGDDGYRGFYFKQKRLLEWLVANRGNCEGYRNTICWMYGAACWSLGLADAAQKVRGLADRMGYDAEGVIRFYEAHGVQKHFSKLYFFDTLGLTAEEIEIYESFGSGRELERAEKRQIKADRNEECLKLKSQGYNQTMIGELLGITRQTVASILKKMEAAAAVVVSKAKETGGNGLRAAVQFFRLLNEFNEMGEVSFDPAEIELPLVDVLELLTVRGSPPLALTG